MSDETDLRSRIRDAVDTADPISPSLAAETHRRRRRRRAATVAVAGLAVGAAIVVPVSLTRHGGGQRVRVGAVTTPAHPSTSAPLSSSSAPGPGTSLPTVRVPNVAGASPAIGAARLGTAGLDVSPDLVQVASTTVPRGEIVGENPPAGAAVTPGTVITLYQSTGRTGPTTSVAPEVTVPALTGESDAQAQGSLNAVGLGPKEQLTPSRTVAAGSVVAESPAAGQPVPRGSTVTLFISSGPNGPGVSLPSSGQPVPTTVPSSTTVNPTTTTLKAGR